MPYDEREVRMQQLVADCPQRRFGRPDEVAAVAIMLASDEAAYMTGSAVKVFIVSDET